MKAYVTSRRSLAGAKRPLEAVSFAKRLRSKIPRRKRVPLLPIVAEISNSEFYADLEEVSSSSCLLSEVTFDRSLGLAKSEVIMKRLRASRAAKFKKPFPEQNPGDEFRRITRSYAKKKVLLRSEEKTEEESGGGGVQCRSRAAAAKGSEAEVSERNAVPDIIISDVAGEFPARNLKEIAASTDAIEKFPQISESSCLETASESKSTKTSNSMADQGSSLQISVRNESERVNLDHDLACSEQLLDTDDDCSEYSTCNEMTLSEIESDLFSGISQGDSSDSSLSVLFESSEDFSERSSENSSPSVAFSLFNQLKQFMRSSNGVVSKEKHKPMQVDSSQEFAIARFEDEEEENYMNIRSRERRDVTLHNFVEKYSSATRYGDRILQQRLVMVNWIVEHSETMDLHHETLFLAVSLMDRFLNRGYFESDRNLQLLGIASATLATRLEEVQPWNSVRTRSFTVGNNVYNRSEVVAMEWLLLEVLNFECMLPTTHSFLWFYLKAANADAEVESLSRYLAVISLLDHERLCFWPSTVAAGLVILACLANNQEASSLRVMETHMHAKGDDLPECIQSLEWLVKYT